MINSVKFAYSFLSSNKFYSIDINLCILIQVPNISTFYSIILSASTAYKPYNNLSLALIRCHYINSFRIITIRTINRHSWHRLIKNKFRISYSFSWPYINYYTKNLPYCNALLYNIHFLSCLFLKLMSIFPHLLHLNSRS